MTWLTKEIIDAAVPEHTLLRYEKTTICSDDTRFGGFHGRAFEEKEWRRLRCCLLEYIDGDAPREFRVFLDTRRGGNVR
jgi:hypothetical protein